MGVLNLINQFPEGILWKSSENRENIETIDAIVNSFVNKKTVEVMATRCDSMQNIVVDFGPATGVIPRSEALYSPTLRIKDIAIISKVGKPVVAKITSVNFSGQTPEITLSRRAVQKEFYDFFLENRKVGNVVIGKITHIDSFGCFVDIGCGIIALLPIDMISVSRIENPKDRFYVGQTIKAVVKNMDDGKILLSHKELLGSWEENAALYSVGETVFGVVRTIKEYGIFVELTPNLAGLAEFRDDIEVGDCVSVYIKNIIPDKMKIKLVIISKSEQTEATQKINYFEDKKHIDSFIYSPLNSSKKVVTYF